MIKKIVILIISITSVTLLSIIIYINFLDQKSLDDIIDTKDIISIYVNITYLDDLSVQGISIDNKQCDEIIRILKRYDYKLTIITPTEINSDEISLHIVSNNNKSYYLSVTKSKLLIRKKSKLKAYKVHDDLFIELINYIYKNDQSEGWYNHYNNWGLS